MISSLLIGFLSVVLYYLYAYHLGKYSDDLPFKYKVYGQSTKPPIVIIPGLDGATAFFADIIPELTVDYYVVSCLMYCDDILYYVGFIEYE